MTAQAGQDHVPLERVTGDLLSAAQLHDLLKLRVDVFVVEQECPYAEVDGLDLLPSTEHLWFADEQGATAAIRLLADPAGRRIGRVVTRPDARGRGLSKQLMDEALSTIGDGPSLLDAQSYLVDFYCSFGFAAAGSEYLEDGIPHTPMTRAGSTTTDRESQ